ncbi:hypothetical protein [Haloprofundus halobius]|uniref:hypothetical protein n=1 Tax=Haloprofundus halobius TaxID=2876194 RepID=UPI001CCBAD8F|nr:hypothetical protein [Haloprofundus halobius]
MLDVIATVPGLTTIGGFAVAVILGGPLAFIGYPIGVGGGNMILPPNANPVLGFVLAFIGGSLTWAGFKTGGWKPFL